MKIFEYNLTPCACRQSLCLAFENYKQKQTPSNAIILSNYLISHLLHVYNIENINVSIKKMMPQGAHQSGHIMINVSQIKNAKNIKNLPELVDVIFHEICHELMFRSNLEIEKSKIIKNEYYPAFIDSEMQNLFKEVFNNDFEMCCYAGMYYYSKNKNEYNARVFAYKNTKQLLQDYLPEIKFNILSFEEKEINRKRKLLSDVNFREYMYCFDRAIINYQKQVLKQELKNLSKEKINNLINSFLLVSNMENKKQLVNQLVCCNNIELLKVVLEKPIIRLEEDEKNALIKAYGNNYLRNIFYNEKHVTTRLL